MSDDDFLSRWSRRKRAVAEEDASLSAPTEEVPRETEPETPEEEDALLARLNLPVPETLKPGDDFSAFMADGVPQFLRKRALRVLWRSNPVLANLDGLNDYDDDFTSPELTQKVLATAYQVGRGIVSQVSAEEAPKETDVVEIEVEEELEEDAEVQSISAENDTSMDTVAHNEDDTAPVKPRRMRFET